MHSINDNALRQVTLARKRLGRFAVTFNASTKWLVGSEISSEKMSEGCCVFLNHAVVLTPKVYQI